MSCRILSAVRTVFAISFCILLMSCVRHDSSTQIGQGSAEERVQNSENPKYDFERDPASVETIRQNIATVKIGDTPLQVVRLLGPATDDSIVRPKNPQQKWEQRVLRYDIRRLSLGSANSKFDQVIVFVFDENDHERLYKIDSTVPEISSRGTLIPPSRSH